MMTTRKYTGFKFIAWCDFINIKSVGFFHFKRHPFLSSYKQCHVHEIRYGFQLKEDKDLTQSIFFFVYLSTLFFFFYFWINIFLVKKSYEFNSMEGGIKRFMLLLHFNSIVVNRLVT